MEGVTGKQPQQQKRREEPPFLEGDESADPLLGEQAPYPDGVHAGLQPRLWGGWGGECGWNTQGKGRCFGWSGICYMRLMLQK